MSRPSAKDKRGSSSGDDDPISHSCFIFNLDIFIQFCPRPNLINPWTYNAPKNRINQYKFLICLQIVFSALVAAANAGIIAAPYAAGIPYAAAGAYPYAYGAAPLAYAQAPVIAKAAPVAAAPVAVAPAPVAVPTPVSSQYQAQDEFGNVNYGYSNINSAKQEVRE